MSEVAEVLKVPYLGNTAIIERHGQYGYWRVYLERGETPEELKGFYTESGLAVKAVEALNNKKSFVRQKKAV